jgi:hypothetical protein
VWRAVVISEDELAPSTTTGDVKLLVHPVDENIARSSRGEVLTSSLRVRLQWNQSILTPKSILNATGILAL